MKTITSDKSLICFKQNVNGAKIGANGETLITFILKPCYANVFRTIANELKDSSKRYASFVKLWENTCNKECENVAAVVADYVKVYKTVDNNVKKDITKVVKKFRGNLGEILVEALFVNNIFNNIGTSKDYTPVDPTNEKYADAWTKSINTKFPIGIQIKNHNSIAKTKCKDSDKYDNEYFLKSTAQHTLCVNAWRNKGSITKEGQQAGITTDNEYLAYTSLPRQYIISFTDTSRMLVKEYENTVIYIGPNDIDKLYLQGSSKNEPNWRLFDDIADEIERLA